MRGIDTSRYYQERQSEIIANSQELNTKKEMILVDKVREVIAPLIGYMPDLIRESKRRFPRLHIEIHDTDVQEYWWNDGTEEGVLIVRFKDYFEVDDITKQIKYGFKYE